ncbi:MAG: hypothetical protein ABID71_10510 [Chloroflexota bacterium]
MKDNSLGIWLIALFGVSGLAVLLLAWLWPGLAAERVPATIAGTVGLGMAVVRTLLLRQSLNSGRQEPVKVQAADRS